LDIRGFTKVEPAPVRVTAAVVPGVEPVEAVVAVAPAIEVVAVGAAAAVVAVGAAAEPVVAVGGTTVAIGVAPHADNSIESTTMIAMILNHFFAMSFLQ
jgi:hypothetical protein